MRDVTKAERKAFIAKNMDRTTALLAQARQFVSNGVECDEDALLLQQIDDELRAAEQRVLKQRRKAAT